MQTAHFHDLHAERLEPGEKPLEGCLIPEGAVQDGFDRLHRGGEPLEVEQGFGGEYPDYADFVVRRWQRSPLAMGNDQTPRSCLASRGTPCTAGEFMSSSPW
jgi:hypothetical protein